MSYTINICIIHLIIQYFYVLNKFSVINLLEKNDGGPQTSEKNIMALGKKGAHCPSLLYIIQSIIIII